MERTYLTRFAAIAAFAASLSFSAALADPVTSHQVYVVSVDFGSAPENFARLKELTFANAKSSISDEAGCRQFDVYEIPNSPNHVFLYEAYDDETAFKQHLASPHYKQFSDETTSIITSRAVSRGNMLAVNRKPN